MQGEIITIGDELTSGRTLDINAWYAAGKLTFSGLRVCRITVVGDNYEMVSQSLKRAMEKAKFVIVTGGLGSTEDDKTCQIVARALNRPLCRDSRMYDLLKSHAEARGLEVSPSLEKMAWMPDGSELISPEHGPCGFHLKEGDVDLYFLPGVPEQMRYLMDKFVIPDLLAKCKGLPVVQSRVLKVFGLTEPKIAEIFKELKGKARGVIFGFYPKFPENHIILSLTDKEESRVKKELDRVEGLVEKLLGPYLFAKGEETMEQVVGKLLKREEITLALAESCTGGLVGHRITNLSGSSEYFQGSVVCYSNRAKEDLLGVRPQTLERYGAVSDQTAQEMAVGVREALKADLAVAITGIAGPTGGSKEKPVGTVYFGLSNSKGVISQSYRFLGSRREVKAQAATMALDWVRRYVTNTPLLPSI